METVSSRVEDGGESPEIRLNNGFKVAITNMFKELRETTFTELKESITMTHLMENTFQKHKHNKNQRENLLLEKMK